MVHSLRTRTLVTAALAVFASCQGGLPHHRGDKVQILEIGSLEAANPADIAIAPIEYSQEGLRAPERMLRESFARALIKRRYSPLSIDFVDTRVIDASFTFGAVGEEAVWQTIVHDWNERDWSTGRILRVDLEVRMLDPQDPYGRPLWSARYPGLVDATPEQSHMTEEALFRWAVDQISLGIAGALPQRDTAPGRPR